MASKDSTPKSGKGSEAARLSDSPLAIRRGNADPTDIDDSPLNLGFSERHDYENTMEPKPPIEPGVAPPPQEPPKSGGQ
jgi:hypothetical protein